MSICINMPKKWFILSVHSSDTISFRVLSVDWPHPFWNTLTSKIFNQLLIYGNLYQHAKNQLISLVHSRDTVSFRVQEQDWPLPFLNHAQPESTQSTFNFCKFVSTWKKLGCFINLFWSNSLFKNPAIWLAESISA